MSEDSSKRLKMLGGNSFKRLSLVSKYSGTKISMEVFKGCLILKIKLEVGAMKYIGYARVSTKEQNLDRQIANIKDFCDKNGLKLHKDKVYTDHYTGKAYAERPGYHMVKEELLEPGDALIISELDRLGRTKNGIIEELQFYEKNDIRVISLDIPTTQIDLSGFEDDMAKIIMKMLNNILIEVYASIAETELIRKQKRQKEGMQAMKDRGEWDKYGRPRVMNDKEFMKEYKLVLDGHIKPTELMRKLQMTKGSYYRYKKRADAELRGIEEPVDDEEEFAISYIEE